MGMSYSFSDVTATLVGPGCVIDLGHGAAVADEGITVSITNPRSTITMGADGYGMHSLQNDKSGTVKITLLKTSPVNARLQTAYNMQSLNANLWGKNVISVSNTASGDKTVCASCAFAKKPDVVYAKAGGTVTWTFNALSIDSILGTY